MTPCYGLLITSVGRSPVTYLAVTYRTPWRVTGVESRKLFKLDIGKVFKEPSVLQEIQSTM